MASDQRQPRTKNHSQTQAQAQKQGQQRAHGPIPLGGNLAQKARGAVVPDWGRGLLLAAGLLLASPAPALAGSVTSESIWDQANAIQRATSQIPRGATVTGNSCQEVDLRGGSTRYICTVTYSTAAPATAPTPAAAPSAGSNGPASNGPSPNAPNAPAP